MNAKKEKEAQETIQAEKPGTITAEELAKQFREHSVAEFFKKNKQMLGLSGKIKTLTTIVHEYVTNALDACESANILPDIKVKISTLGEEHYEVTVEDNGPGLTKETVGKAFGKLLAGTKFHRLVQMRGQQGIGAAGVTLLSQMTTGKEVKVITGTGKETISVEMSIDAKTNEPKISNVQTLAKPFRGTAVKAQFKDVKYVNSEQSPLEYLRRTAIANPHAKITFQDPEGQVLVFDRSNKTIPPKPTEVKPHPKGVTVDDVVTLSKITEARKVSTFLKTEFDRVGDNAVGEIEKGVSFDTNKDPKQLTWQEVEELVKMFRKVNFIAPRTDGLRPISEERVRKSLESILQPEFLTVVTRKPTVYQGGFPFQVETAIAFGGSAGRKIGEEYRAEVMRFANNVPLLFDSGGCAITTAVKNVDWSRYGIKDIETSPVTIFVNLLSVKVPYTGAGKQAVADEAEIIEEIRLGLMDAGRKTARYIVGKERERLKQEKRRIFTKYAIEVARATGEMLKKDPKPIEKKLLDIVIKHLKIEEAKEQELETQSDEELEKQLKQLQKEQKETGKTKKKKAKEGSGGDEE